MTIQGALSDLNNLLEADDIPGYYKPSIKKVIETIEQESCESTAERKKYEAVCITCNNLENGIEAQNLNIKRLIEYQKIVEAENKELRTKIPKGATNGDMIKAMFNPYKICEYEYSVHVYMTEKDFWESVYQMNCHTRWWNAPYESEVSK